MEIRIYTGENQISEGYIKRKMKQDARDNIPTSSFKEEEILHPYKLYKRFYELLNSHKKEDNSIYIATYSDHILNAVRVFVKEQNFSNAKIYFYKNTEELIIIDILPNGKLSAWPDGLFDMWEKALMKLL